MENSSFMALLPSSEAADSAIELRPRSNASSAWPSCKEQHKQHGRKVGCMQNLFAYVCLTGRVYERAQGEERLPPSII